MQSCEHTIWPPAAAHPATRALMGMAIGPNNIAASSEQHRQPPFEDDERLLLHELHVAATGCARRITREICPRARERRTTVHLDVPLTVSSGRQLGWPNSSESPRITVKPTTAL